MVKPLQFSDGSGYKFGLEFHTCSRRLRQLQNSLYQTDKLTWFFSVFCMTWSCLEVKIVDNPIRQMQQLDL